MKKPTDEELQLAFEYRFAVNQQAGGNNIPFNTMIEQNNYNKHRSANRKVIRYIRHRFMWSSIIIGLIGGLVMIGLTIFIHLIN